MPAAISRLGQASTRTRGVRVARLSVKTPEDSVWVCGVWGLIGVSGLGHSWGLRFTAAGLYLRLGLMNFSSLDAVLGKESREEAGA